MAADSLDTVMREHGPAPAAEALRIIDAARRRRSTTPAVVGVVHGALHPRDVLISPDDVRLTGLGVARALERVGVQRSRAPSLCRARAGRGRRVGPAGRRVHARGARARAALGPPRSPRSAPKRRRRSTSLPGAALNRLRETFRAGAGRESGAAVSHGARVRRRAEGLLHRRQDARPAPPQRATAYRRRPRTRRPSTREAPPLVGGHCRSCRCRGEERAKPRRPADERDVEVVESADRADQVEPVIARVEHAEPSRSGGRSVRADLDAPRARLPRQTTTRLRPSARRLRSGAGERAAAQGRSSRRSRRPRRADVRVEPPVRFEHPVSFGSRRSRSSASAFGRLAALAGAAGRCRARLRRRLLARAVASSAAGSGMLRRDHVRDRSAAQDRRDGWQCVNARRRSVGCRAAGRGDCRHRRRVRRPPAPAEPPPAAPPRRARRASTRCAVSKPRHRLPSRARAASRCARRRLVRGSRSTAATSARRR